MIIIIMLSLTTSIFIILIKINNPIQITLIIICIALIVATIFCRTLSSWYAFLIFLIYVGGILVIFAYFTASSPNQQYISTKKIIKGILSFTLVTGRINILINNLINITPSKSNQLISIFTVHNIYTLIIITLVLLITIVIVVKLCSRSKGPLRTFIT
jgi:NADH-ubiquinone oxidoreductase chain 6